MLIRKINVSPSSMARTETCQHTGRKKGQDAVKHLTLFIGVVLAVDLFGPIACHWLNRAFNDLGKMIKLGVYATQVYIRCSGPLMAQKPLNVRQVSLLRLH